MHGFDAPHGRTDEVRADSLAVVYDPENPQSYVAERNRNH